MGADFGLSMAWSFDHIADESIEAVTGRGQGMSSNIANGAE